jgi:hypothetical protein
MTTCGSVGADVWSSSALRLPIKILSPFALLPGFVDLLIACRR